MTCLCHSHSDCRIYPCCHVGLSVIFNFTAVWDAPARGVENLFFCFRHSSWLQFGAVSIHLGESILVKFQVCVCKNFHRRTGTSVLPDNTKPWTKVVVLINTPTSNVRESLLLHILANAWCDQTLGRIFAKWNDIFLWFYLECLWLWMRLRASLWDTFFFNLFSVFIIIIPYL